MSRGRGTGDEQLTAVARPFSQHLGRAALARSGRMVRMRHYHRQRGRCGRRASRSARACTSTCISKALPPLRKICIRPGCAPSSNRPRADPRRREGSNTKGDIVEIIERFFPGLAQGKYAGVHHLPQARRLACSRASYTPRRIAEAFFVTMPPRGQPQSRGMPEGVWRPAARCIV